MLELNTLNMNNTLFFTEITYFMNIITFKYFKYLIKIKNYNYKRKHNTSKTVN